MGWYPGGLSLIQKRTGGELKITRIETKERDPKQPARMVIYIYLYI